MATKEKITSLVDGAQKYNLEDEVYIANGAGMDYDKKAIEGQAGKIIEFDSVSGTGYAKIQMHDTKKFPHVQWVKLEQVSKQVPEFKPTVDVEAEAKKFASASKATAPLGKNDILGQDKAKKLLQIAINRDMPALIIGDTGCGKTTVVKSIAEEMNREYVRYNITGETTVDEFIGKWILKDEETVWMDGVLLQAMKEGKFLIVDEINAALPEILFVLHSLLDDERAVLVAQHMGEVVKPHPDFRFFATMNPVDEYAGTKDLNKAFKSRFNIIISMDYPEAKIEAQVVAAKTGVKQEVANVMVDIARQVRDAKGRGEIFYTCSTRDLIQWGNLMADIDQNEAFEVAVLSKANGDSDIMRKIYRNITGKALEIVAKGGQLNVEFFASEYEKLNTAYQEMKLNRDQIKKEVIAEITAKLT